MSEATVKSSSDHTDVFSSENVTAVEAVSERLSEVTGLAEELDQAIKSAQQDCAISPAATTQPIPINNQRKTETSITDEDHPSSSRLRVEDARSDDEFQTASDCTLQHSRSSSYNTASDCEHMYSPWWDYGKDDNCEDLVKEKMVLAVGLPELPVPSSVLHPSPEVPPGKIAREVTETTHIKVQQSHTFGVKSFVLTSETVRDKKDANGLVEEVVKVDSRSEEFVDDDFERRLKECGDWMQLKILEVTPELTALGNTLSEALELQKAHDEVLRQLQNKQSPVEELLRQADQLIATQKPRAEVYAAMAESLGKAWQDVNVHLELRKMILDLNVQYHTRADEFFERMHALESACSDTLLPIEIEAVRNLLTNAHNLRRSVLESLKSALERGNALIGKLKELGAEGTLDSRPDQIRTSVNRAISQVQEWMDKLHLRRQVLESTFTRRKEQLEQCLALAMLAADLRELEVEISTRRELLNNSDQLGDSSSSAEILRTEHKRLLPEAKQLQEKVLKITKATEQLEASKCFESPDAIRQAYTVLSFASDYLSDLQQRDSLYEKVIAFFKSAQEALSNLNNLEMQLNTSGLSPTSPELAQLHSRCASSIEEITSDPISQGYAILEATSGLRTNTTGVKNMIDELENRKITLGNLCVAHKEENRRINQALNTFNERNEELYGWLVGIAEAFIKGHQNMGTNLSTAREFLELHNHLLTDLQTKGNEINALLLTLPPIMEYINDAQRRDIDTKVEGLHECWIKLKNILESRLELALLYVKFHTEADQVRNEMEAMQDLIRQSGDDITDDGMRMLEEKMETLQPLYQSAKNTGLTFVNKTQKVADPHLDTKRASDCVESVLNDLSAQTFTINRTWQTFHTEVIEKREIILHIETNMVESTKTINWVSKLDTQLYPVITTHSTNPKEICTHIEQKMETVLKEIKRAQTEVEQRIQTAETLLAKSSKPDEKTIAIKSQLNNMHQRLVNISSDYQILSQMMISYFNMMDDLTKNINSINAKLNEGEISKSLLEIEKLSREHDACKQGVQNMFKVTERNMQEIVSRINNQEPKESGQQDIEKLKYNLHILKENFEREWRAKWDLLEAQRQYCQFDTDLQQINETIDDLSHQLAGVKGKYGESLAAAKAMSLAFVHFEKTIEHLEERINNFISTGENMLKDQHMDSNQIMQQIKDLQNRWNSLKNQITETRNLIDLSIKYFELVDEANEWFKEGNRLLLPIARRSTTVKHPEEAQELLNEIEIFLKPGESKQNERIRKISEIGSQLFGQENPQEVQIVLVENREMMESFSAIRNDIYTLSQNLRHAEEERQRMLKEQEEAERERIRIEKEQEAERERLRILREKEAAEQERLRILREQELEKERLRIQQEQEAEKERLRLQQEKEEAERERLRILREQEAEKERLRLLKEQEEIKRQLEASRAEAEAAREEAARLAEEQRLRFIKEQEEAEKQRLILLQQQEEAEKQKLILLQQQEEAEKQRLILLRQQEESRIQLEAAKAEAARAQAAAEEARQKAEIVHKVENISEVREIPIQITHSSSSDQELQITEIIDDLPTMEPPVFITPLYDQIIEEGGKFTFVCQVTGVPVPVVTWHKAGVSIQNNLDYQTTFDHGLCTLTIEETFVDDSARYTCKAINAAGSAETAAFLSVKENQPEEQLSPPNFIKHLQPGLAKEGEPFQFECTVEGNPLPTVQWFKNFDCIDNSPDYIINYNNGDAVLKFEQAFLEDKADYSCKATNELGTAQSTANLNVIPLEPTESPAFVTPLCNAMARAGQKIKLECEVSGLPPPNLIWSHNGKPVKETRELKLHRDGQKATLIIHEAFPKDAGAYTVTASNLAGQTSSACNVSVKGRLPAETSDSELASDMEPIKPSIQVPLKDISINEGNRVRLDCVIVGQPEPEVIWYHDDCPIKESPDFQLLFQGDRCSLVIQEALIEDAGEYKVKALNSAGEASSKANLVVTAIKKVEKEVKPEEEKLELTGSAPKFSKLLTDILVSEGEKVILEAAVSGDPRPETKWLLNNNPINSNERIHITHDDEGNLKLEIDNVKLEDRGVYTVKATNSSGDAKCFAQLIVKSLRMSETTKVHEEIKSAPVFKETFSDKSVFENTATKFECIVTGKPAPKVRWLFNDVPVSGKNFLISTSGVRQVLSIPEVSKEHGGKIECIAENEVGKASCTAMLSVNSVSEITLPETDKKSTEIVILPTEWSKDVQQHTESNFTYKREINVQSSTSSSSKIITSTSATPEPFIEEHKYSTKDEKSFKQINLQAPEIQESHKEEEYHKVGKEPPVTHEKSTSVYTIGGKEVQQTILPAKEIVLQKSIFKTRPPKFVTPVIGKIVDQEANVVLEGILDGQPTPQVFWTKNGVEFKSNDNAKVTYEHNCARIELKNVTINDSGKYSCTATNEAGKAISTADLVVRKTVFPPVFGRRLQAQVIKKDDRVNMEVEVTGTPEPTVTWFKDGKPIEEAIQGGYRIKTQGNCHTLILEKAELKHTGKYMVRAINPGGEAQSIADIAVYEPTPDTMIEVVKTVVFEDVRKHETLTSAADKSLETITTGPVVVTQPEQIPISLSNLYESSKPLFSQSFTTEISQHTEDSIKHDTKTLTLERTTPVPDIQMPKKYEKEYATESFMETKIEQPSQESIDEGIQTTSISKKQSLDFFVKKIKEVEEPAPIKELIKPAPIKQELYTKFEETQEKSQETYKSFEIPKFEPLPQVEVPKPQPVFTPQKIETPKPAFMMPPITTESYSSVTDSKTEFHEEFILVPEPPAEICFEPQQQTVIKEDVCEKVKRIEDVSKGSSYVEKSKEVVNIVPQVKEESSQFTKEHLETSKTEYYKAETIGPIVRPISPKPSQEGIEMEKLWTPKLETERPASSISMQSFEKQTFTRPMSALSTGSFEPSAEGLAMEKTWAHKHTESNIQKSWPPMPTETPKITPTWSAQSTLEKKWVPTVTSETVIKESSTPVVSESYYKESSKTVTSEILPPPLAVPHYIAQVSHTSNINEVSQSSYSEHKESKMEIKKEMHNEFISEERNAKPSEVIKSWPPKQKEEVKPIPTYKPVQPLMETIRPVSVQDITDEIYLEPGSPPEMAYAPPTQRRISYVETIEQDLERNLDKGPSKVLPGAIRTMPPPLPPKKEQVVAPPVPAKTTKQVEVPFEKFPELEPFPFKPEPVYTKPVKVGPPPTPSKFIKGKFTDSDYESDFEAIRIHPKWKPYASDTDEPSFRHVNPPKISTLPRSRSIDKEALPPSKFDQPPVISGPPRPMINFEACKQIRKESQFQKKQTQFTKTQEFVKKEEVSPPLKPGSPPIFLQAEPKSPKTKPKMVIDGYMADTDEPFSLQQRKMMKSEFRHEEKSESKQVYSSQNIVQTQEQKFTPQAPKTISVPKTTHYKKHVSSGASSKKKLVSTPIVTSVSTSERIETKCENLQPFPFKPDPPAGPKLKVPPPPSPSKFVKGEFRESDYESDYESRIQSMWRSEDKHYKPVRPLLTPSGKQQQSNERVPTPPTEFEDPQRVSIPSRPKFEPIEKASKTVKLDQIIKPVPKPTPIFRPKPIIQQTPITDLIIATPAAPEKVILLQPGTPPEIAYAPGPKKTQYYRSTTSAPYHNAIQTETSNVMHFNESTEHSHRTVSLQQTTKVIKFGDQSKKTQEVLEPFPFKAEPERPRRGSAPPPPKPKKFVPGEFRESDYESEVENTRIKSKWTPGYKENDEPHYRKVRAPAVNRSSSVPASRDRVETPMEFDTQPAYSSSQYSSSSNRFSENKSSQIVKSTYENNLQPGSPPEYGITSQKLTKQTANKIATQYMDNMTHTFKSKAQQFASDIMDDVNKKSNQRPILKSKDDSDAQVYREESRAAQYGTKHVDPDTGLIYFKYDFGYEFGILFPGQSKPGEIPVPKKTIIQPPQRSESIEMPVHHETSQPKSQAPTPNFQPKKFGTNKNVKWEPTSESEMSEYEAGGKNKSRWEQSSCSPVSLSPSLPSTSPAFNNYSGSGLRGTETPPSCPSTPGVSNAQIKRAPVFITPLRDIAAVSGQTARFECIVQSEPTPNILWSKNGRIIENSNDYQLFFRNGVCRLTIPKAYPEDAGTYTCTATNQVGAIGTTATLQVPGERRSSYI